MIFEHLTPSPFCLRMRVNVQLGESMWKMIILRDIMVLSVLPVHRDIFDDES